jgi:hypothetical protein
LNILRLDWNLQILGSKKAVEKYTPPAIMMMPRNGRLPEPLPALVHPCSKGVTSKDCAVQSGRAFVYY